MPLTHTAIRNAKPGPKARWMYTRDSVKPQMSWVAAP